MKVYKLTYNVKKILIVESIDVIKDSKKKVELYKFLKSMKEYNKNFDI